MDVFGRAPAWTWCFNPAVLSEAVHLGSTDLGLPQLSMQRAVPGEGCNEVAPWQLKLLNARR